MNFIGGSGSGMSLEHPWSSVVTVSRQVSQHLRAWRTKPTVIQSCSTVLRHGARY